MIDLLFGPLTVWFGVPALIGSLFFVLRLVMVAAGLDFGDGADGDAGGFADGGGGEAGFDGAGADDGAGVDDGLDHAESSTVFKFLSLQTITAFCMGFGWGGLLGLETLDLGMPASVGVGVLTGIAFAWLIIWCFTLMYAMESSGNVSIRQAMDCEGIATSAIPAGGDATGRVRLTIGQRQRAYGARTHGEAIHTGARVRVTKINEDNTVTVIRA